ncbi:hypothetical protein D3C87_148460 [compost metagenome]
MRKLFLTLLIPAAMFSCKQEKHTSLADVKMRSREIIEEKALSQDTTLKVADYSLGRATEYKYEGSMTLSNDEEYDIVVYYDQNDIDDDIQVKWQKKNLVSGF